MIRKLMMGGLVLVPVGALAGLHVSSAAPQPSLEPGQELSDAEQRRAEQLERLENKNEEQRAARRARNVDTLRAMQGGWQLIDYTSTIMPDPGRQDIAFVVVGGEFLTIEIHMGYFDENDTLRSRLHQTGSYRLNFNEESDLLAQLLIGTMDVGDGFTDFQIPGVVSIYEADVHGDVLTLISEDYSRFKFERIKTGALTELLYEEVDWLPGAQEREELAATRILEASVEGDAAPVDHSTNLEKEGSPETKGPPSF
jgi:hypothetical protein